MTILSRKREAAAEQAAVDAWNAAHPVGTPVTAYPGIRPEDSWSPEKVTRIVTTTRSKATVLGGHTAVVWVHGHSACIALTHVDVRTAATPGELAEMRHLLYDADEDATVPAFPYPVAPQEAAR
ncbi:hypothetical protein [Streptomyces sp. SID685]|uniref:hypothetical protein n=1 Tax=Streptomyces sp. SID685 TaxID=2690322 RepID=UPI0019278087|nr:hypothetical protein [Streptomyces sp. SID685]